MNNNSSAQMSTCPKWTQCVQNESS